MSILSTNKKIIKLGDDYSAGPNIGINDRVISSRDWTPEISAASAKAFEEAYNASVQYTDDVIYQLSGVSGKLDVSAFSAWNSATYEPNTTYLSGAIDYVSGKALTSETDWTDTITGASAYAYEEAIAQIPPAFDPSFISGQIDSAFTDIGYISGQVDNKLDKSESANYLLKSNSSMFYPMDSNPAGYLTQHQDLSNYYQKNETSSKQEISAAIAAIPLGDEEVNQVVHQYSAAGTWLTAHQSLSAYLTKASADTLYQPIGDYATNTDLEQVSGEIVNLIPSTAGLATEQLVEDTSATITGMIPSTAGLATETDLQIVSGGVDYISGVALTSIPTGTMNVTGFEYDADDLITAYNGSAFAGQGGGSVDTIPFVVQEPLVTGFTGDSAYIGLESTAINLSAYVPYSAITLNSNYISQISGKQISAYTARYANYSTGANTANTATRAYGDRNGNEITSYYQPKLTIAGEDGTITAINSSAIGGTMTAAFELSAGDGISITDDLDVSATVISVTAAGGNPEVESYVQTNSASIDDAVSTYQSNSGSYITQETDWTNTITAASSYAYSEATALIPTDYYTTANPSGFITNVSAENTYQTIAEMTAYQPIGSYATTGELDTASSFLSGSIDYVSGALTEYLTTGQYETDSAVFNAKQDALTFTTADAVATASNYGYYPGTGISGVNGSAFIIPMRVINYFDQQLGKNISAINRIYRARIAADLDVNGYYITATYQKVSGVSATEWNSNYDTVNTNSGTWNGVTGKQDALTFGYDEQNNISAINSSSISTTPAQDLYAKSPLYFGTSGTSSFMGFDASAISADLARMMGVDETLLYSGSDVVSSCTLSESLTNFNYIAIETPGAQTLIGNERQTFKATNGIINLNYLGGYNSPVIRNLKLTANNTDISVLSSIGITFASWTGGTTGIRYSNNDDLKSIISVYGIGRKS